MTGYRIFAAASLLALAACGAPADDDAAQLGAPGAGLAGADGFATAVNCFARLEAMSRLYSALASAQSGAEQAEFNHLSSEREGRSVRYQRIAGRLGEEIGRSTGEVDAALREARQAVEREREALPFEDFAVWVGGEADRCPPPVDA